MIPLLLRYHLAEASSVSSSESANRVLASESTKFLLGGTVSESYVIDGDKVTKTTETVELHNDLSTIKVGGPIKSAAQLGKVTKKKTVTRPGVILLHKAGRSVQRTGHKAGNYKNTYWRTGR